MIDLGCGEGDLLLLLMNEPMLKRIAGLDVSLRALQIAERRLKRHLQQERMHLAP